MSSLKIGFVGLGNIGMSMARTLARRGFPLTVYDVRKEAVERMATLGARGAGSCREVALASDIVISMVRRYSSD